MKQFKIPSANIKSVALGHGSCIASDRITVDGSKVGYMYREPARDAIDSGWTFLAGDETQGYLDRVENLAFYDCNTVANYDSAIIPFLDAPVGSAYERRGEGFEPSEGPPNDDEV